MRSRMLISLALLLALSACNNSGDKSAAGTDTSQAKTDTMAMKVDSSKIVPAVPDEPAGAKVFFKNLKNGQSVTSPVKVEMGVEGLKLDTAGAIVAGTGHHHLFIDAEDSLAKGTVIPKDSTHLHFGKAQSEAVVKLSPGMHKLTLQFADGIHRSYGAQLSDTVRIRVKK